jgi:hypothetical protein
MFILIIKAVFVLFQGKDDFLYGLFGWLFDWCLTPTLAVFQLYHGCCIGLADRCLLPTLAVFQLYPGMN